MDNTAQRARVQPGGVFVQGFFMDIKESFQQATETTPSWRVLQIHTYVIHGMAVWQRSTILQGMVPGWPRMTNVFLRAHNCGIFSTYSCRTLHLVALQPFVGSWFLCPLPCCRDHCSVRTHVAHVVSKRELWTKVVAWRIQDTALVAFLPTPELPSHAKSEGKACPW